MSDRAILPPDTRMTRDEYFAWAEQQPLGRFERVDGIVVAMAPERVGHGRRKARVWLALESAVAANRLPCEVLPDGMTVSVGDSDFEPDAVLYCGDRLSADRKDVPEPVVIVEVLSPSTKHVDLTRKMAAYFDIPSVSHHLIFWADERRAVHHRRRPGETGIDTRIVGDGTIELDPPGLVLSLDEIYAD